MNAQVGFVGLRNRMLARWWLQKTRQYGMSCAPGYQPHVKLANGRSSQKLAPNDPHDPTRVPLNCTNSPRLIWTVSISASIAKGFGHLESFFPVVLECFGGRRENEPNVPECAGMLFFLFFFRRLLGRGCGQAYPSRCVPSKPTNLQHSRTWEQSG